MEFINQQTQGHDLVPLMWREHSSTAFLWVYKCDVKSSRNGSWGNAPVQPTLTQVTYRGTSRHIYIYHIIHYILHGPNTLAEKIQAYKRKIMYTLDFGNVLSRRENLPNQNITSIRLLGFIFVASRKKHTVLPMHYCYYYYHHHPYYKYYYFYILLNSETTLCFLKIDKTVT